MRAIRILFRYKAQIILSSLNFELVDLSPPSPNTQQIFRTELKDFAVKMNSDNANEARVVFYKGNHGSGNGGCLGLSFQNQMSLMKSIQNSDFPESEWMDVRGPVLAIFILTWGLSSSFVIQTLLDRRLGPDESYFLSMETAMLPPQEHQRLGIWPLTIVKKDQLTVPHLREATNVDPSKCYAGYAENNAGTKMFGVLFLNRPSCFRFFPASLLDQYYPV